MEPDSTVKLGSKIKITQNSGISITSKTISYASRKDKNPVVGDVNYYGILTGIIELDYDGEFNVVLFRGDWVDVVDKSLGCMKDSLGFTLVNFKHLMYRGEPSIRHEPFFFSSQVQQVFYVQDLTTPDWHVVLETRTRDLYIADSDSDEETLTDDNDRIPLDPPHLEEYNVEEDNPFNWVRSDICDDE